MEVGDGRKDAEVKPYGVVSHSIYESKKPIHKLKTQCVDCIHIDSRTVRQRSTIHSCSSSWLLDVETRVADISPEASRHRANNLAPRYVLLHQRMCLLYLLHLEHLVDKHL